jgi:hypothetical protein
MDGREFRVEPGPTGVSAVEKVPGGWDFAMRSVVMREGTRVSPDKNLSRGSR